LIDVLSSSNLCALCFDDDSINEKLSYKFRDDVLSNLGRRAVKGAPRAIRLPASETWGNPRTLARHFRDHGGDFAAKSADEYAEMASDFLHRSQLQRLPTKIDADGVIRVYDPATNTFGAYNPSGTTRTFFMPKRGVEYWNDQPGVAPWGPGG
jgi:pyocin large subunit-like protein